MRSAILAVMLAASTAQADVKIKPEPAGPPEPAVDGSEDRPTMARQVALGAFLAIGGGVFGGYLGGAAVGPHGGENNQFLGISGGAYTGASMGFALGIGLAGDEGLQQNAYFGAAAGSFLGGASGLLLAIGAGQLATDNDGILGLGVGLVVSGWVAGGLVGYYAVRERSHAPIVRPTLNVDAHSHATSVGLAGSF